MTMKTLTKRGPARYIYIFVVILLLLYISYFFTETYKKPKLEIYDYGHILIVLVVSNLVTTIIFLSPSGDGARILSQNSNRFGQKLTTHPSI